MKHLTTFLYLLLLTSYGQAQDHARSSVQVKGDKAFLGINFERISEEKAVALGFENPHGSYITGIIGNTAAEKAGLQPFDYVYGIDDARTAANRTIGDLLAKYQAGDEATVHLMRQGKARQVTVTFLDRHSAGSNRKSGEGGRPFLGINRHTDNDDEAIGVRVFTSSNSTAQMMGLQNGDVITAINGYPIVDWRDITTAINMLEVGEEITVSYQRNGEPRKASAPIKSYAESNEQKGRVSEWKQEEKAFFGILSSNVSKEKARWLGSENAHGSYITGVLKNTAAQRAGMQPFDYVYGIDEYRTGEGQNLGQILYKYKPGDKAEVHFFRQKRKQTVPVTFGRREDAERQNKSKCEDPFFGIRQTHGYESEEGIPVEVVASSTAEAMGLRDGDVITRINGHPILDWEDIGIAINNMQVGAPIEVAYRRQGKVQTRREPIKSHCDTRPEPSALDLDLDFDFDFGGKDSAPAGRMDLSNAKVDMREVTREESQRMKQEHGVDMPAVSNLRVEALGLYPNPNRGMFRLQFELPERGETRIRIYNAAGRLIYNYDLGSFQGEFSDEVDISQNGAGSYFLEIRQGNRSLTRKVVLSGL